MNFRTTLALIILLAAAGMLALVSKRSSNTSAPPPLSDKVLTMASDSINRLSISSDAGKPMQFERDGLNWKMTSPVSAPADVPNVNRLIDGLLALTPTGTAPATGADAAATGLDSPRFQIEIGTKDGKTTKVKVGDKASTGDSMYVLRDGATSANIVSVELDELINKPAKDFRRARLLDLQTSNVKQLLLKTDSQKLELVKDNSGWRIISPETFPGDEREISDVLFALSGLAATGFLSDDPNDARRARMIPPELAISFAVEQTSTAASGPVLPPKVTRLLIGSWSDVTRKNVYAAVEGEPTLYTVSSASVDAFRKTARDLRDRMLINLKADQVQMLEISVRRAGTLSLTGDTTTVVRATPDKTLGPATTQAVESAKWKLSGPTTAPVNERAVDGLIAAIAPLRVERYVAQVATTQPVDDYTVVIHATDAKGASESHTIRFQQGADASVCIGNYNGVIFEAAGTLLDKLKADLTKAETSTPDEPFPQAPRN